VTDKTSFEADLNPATHMPRMRFNFTNGWSASLALRCEASPCNFLMAAVAAVPGGNWGQGNTQLGETEASADEAIAYLASIADRPAQSDRGGELGSFGVHSADAEATDDGLVQLRLWKSNDAGPLREYRQEKIALLDWAHAVELLGTLARAVEQVRPAMPKQELS
jgi:hypothetical protein